MNQGDNAHQGGAEEPIKGGHGGWAAVQSSGPGQQERRAAAEVEAPEIGDVESHLGRRRGRLAVGDAARHLQPVGPALRSWRSATSSTITPSLSWRRAANTAPMSSGRSQSVSPSSAWRSRGRSALMSTGSSTGQNLQVTFGKRSMLLTKCHRPRRASSSRAVSSSIYTGDSTSTAVPDSAARNSTVPAAAGRLTMPGIFT
jgi:hypothetical protein